MTTTVNLETTQTELEHLHEKVAERRALAVKVEREALTHLLGDHARLSAALSGSTAHKLVEPVRVRQRSKS
jgi:hypothetical protein